MKKLLLLVALFAFAFTFQAEAQMKVKKFGISLGQDWDMLPGLSTETILRKTDGRLSQDLESFFDLPNSSQYSSACDNPNFRLSLVFEPERWRNVELHTSGVFIFNRMDAVYLYDNDNYGYSNLNIILHGNEIDAEAVLLKRVPVFGFLNRKFFNLYGGIGSNVGYQFGNYISVRGHNQTFDPGRQGNFRDATYINDYTDITDGVSARVFAQVGYGITFFRKLELGFEARYGAGLRHNFMTNTDFTNLHSVAFNMKYVLGNRMSRAERELKRIEKAERSTRCNWESYKRCQGW